MTEGKVEPMYTNNRKLVNNNKIRFKLRSLDTKRWLYLNLNTTTNDSKALKIN